MSAMLNVRGVASGYGRIGVLNDVNFSVAEHEFVGVLGHNGMGKSTLLRTLVGHLKATRGVIEFAGKDVTPLPADKRAALGLGYVPQGREIFPGLTVRENLEFASVASGKKDPRIVEAMIEDFPRLKPILDRAGGVLSGGEQQILAIARCLCAQPKLVLLDEPTEGIQPSIVEEIMELLTRLKSRGQLTIVLVEQNLEFIASLSQRILIIQKGRIIKETKPEEAHQHDLIEEFTGVDT